MSTRNYTACRKRISEQHGQAPTEFLDTLIDTIDGLPDEVFARNNHYDIYSAMQGVLGPYTSLRHRKAVMCEVLRVVAAFESDWDWDEGVDVSKPKANFRKETEETGAFQVSWDSLPSDASLKDCVNQHAGGHDVDTFIAAMKANHPLAVEYCARLFRFNTSWCGTVRNENMVIAHVSRDAVEEFSRFLKPVVSDNVPLISTAAAHDSPHVGKLTANASDAAMFKDMQARAARKLLVYAGEKYPTDGCAITLSLMLQDAGIAVRDTYMAIELTNILGRERKWEVIPVGHQQKGDIGTTCGRIPRHGYDHIYLVLETMGDDEMLIADNQKPQPHPRWASGKGGKTPTKYFLRAV